MAGSNDSECFMFDLITLVGISENYSIPEKFLISQNFPNPFNPVTKIKYSIPVSGYVTLKVYDKLVNEITSLVEGSKNSSINEVVFNADRCEMNMSSSVYK